MPHLEQRTVAVQALGWSAADAHWLALVCLYSGVFTRLQYRDWHHRNQYAASRFVQASHRCRRRPGTPPSGPAHTAALLPCLRANPLPRPRHRERPPAPSRIVGPALAAPAHPGLPARLSRRELARHRCGEAPLLPQTRIRRRGVARSAVSVTAPSTTSPSTPSRAGKNRLCFVFPDPGHGTNRALYYWASDHLYLWEALRREGVEVEVIVAVRDDAAKSLYERTLFRWTPAGAALNEDERSFLEAIQAARRHPDMDEIGKWLGWEDAAEIEARLRPRLHRPPGQDRPVHRPLRGAPGRL